MRLFLASFATLPDYAALRRRFEGVLEGTWVAPEHLHYTLWFFGERSDPARLIEQLRTIPFPHKKGVVSGLGMLGRRGKKVLYAKLKHDPWHRSVQLLAERFATRRVHHRPHITLLRIKHYGGDYHKILHAYRHEELGFTHAQVALVESRLTAQGPIYRPIAYF